MECERDSRGGNFGGCFIICMLEIPGCFVSVAYLAITHTSQSLGYFHLAIEPVSWCDTAPLAESSQLPKYVPWSFGVFLFLESSTPGKRS